MESPIYKAIARKLTPWTIATDSGIPERRAEHAESIEFICREFAPSGSGFDNGTRLDLDASNSQRLVFVTSFHHMNDTGYYCGWTDHKVTVRPSFAFDFDLSIGGRNRNDIKEYIADVFGEFLRRAVDV